nr:hypothetical protein [Micromonospora sp. DSM 115978]
MLDYADTVVKRGAGALVVGVLLMAGCGADDGLPTGDWRHNGAEVSAAKIESYAGDDHCDWQEAHFLHVVWPLSGESGQRRQFVRDPEGVTGVPELRQGFRADAELPTDAAPTGYENDGTELWLAGSDQDVRAYLVSESGEKVEAWPRADPPVGCD